MLAPASITKLVNNVGEWTSFYGTMPQSADHLSALPERFVRRWATGALTDCRLGLLKATIATQPAGSQRAALQRWYDNATREHDPRYVSRMLGNTTKHMLMVAAVPEEERVWAKLIFDEHWDWAVGLMVVACALTTGANEHTAPETTAALVACLQRLAAHPAKWTALATAAASRAVGSVVNFVTTDTADA